MNRAAIASVAALLTLALGLCSAGCSGGSSGKPPPASSPTAGSRYWHQGNDLTQPYKTHSAQEATWAQDVLTLVNQERANQGLAPLAWDAPAALAAKVHAEDMLWRSYFSHTTPEGWDPGDRLSMTGASGYSAWGENIAWGQASPADVMTAWMNSAGHRANILNPNYTHIGVGVAEGPPIHWVQVFLRRP